LHESACAAIHQRLFNKIQFHGSALTMTGVFGKQVLVGDRHTAIIQEDQAVLV
jgi:hypothetical protein